MISAGKFHYCLGILVLIFDGSCCAGCHPARFHDHGFGHERDRAHAPQREQAHERDRGNDQDPIRTMTFYHGHQTHHHDRIQCFVK